MPRFIISALILTTSATVASAETFQADVWVDNWFEMRVDGRQVAEDSVPITTERSFNVETFNFEAERPFVVGLVARDFIQNDTGLEYIGTGRQQMGDGGAIVQIKDAVGNTVAVSDGNWRCLTIHTAPLDAACVEEENPVPGSGACTFTATDEPVGWDHVGFEDADWPQASVFSESDVSPKGGYDQIDWNDAAQLIWGADLKKSNTVLCRMTVE